MKNGHENPHYDYLSSKGVFFTGNTSDPSIAAGRHLPYISWHKVEGGGGEEKSR
jgi:hypothetical protein